MFGLNGMWGHSGGYRSVRAPEQGQWDYAGGDLWLNDQQVPAPEWPFKSLPWTDWGKGRIEEAPLTQEGYFFRPPVKVHFKEGWNKVLIRSVFGHWKEDKGQRKWFFCCIPVTWDGASGENILWKIAIPLHGYNSPVIWDDKLFLTGANTNVKEVYCIDSNESMLAAMLLHSSPT